MVPRHHNKVQYYHLAMLSAIMPLFLLKGQDSVVQAFALSHQPTPSSSSLTSVSSPLIFHGDSGRNMHTSSTTTNLSARYRRRHLSASTSLHMKSSQNPRRQDERPETQVTSSVSEGWYDYSVSIDDSSGMERPYLSLFRDLQTCQRQSHSLVWESTILPVLSASLLITGNTVGAGMLVLPELAAEPGMALSTGIFIAAFGLNWLSGVLIAEVAIRQQDTSGTDVPSSFKEFAQVNLPTNNDVLTTYVSNGISGISILVNALVMAFNMAKVGDFGVETLQGVMPVGSSILPDATMISMAWIMACVILVGTQSFTNLSIITSIFVVGLFGSFTGLLLPGLTHMDTGPLELLWQTPGTSPDVLASACQLAPIVLMSLVYQNIVPTVTKLLDYDRTKSVAAITLGSFLPLGMYVAWAFCVLGGGVGLSSTDLLDHGGGESSLMTLFTLTTIAGSSIGCVMSLAEEFDSFQVETETSTDPSTSSDKFSFSSVLLSVASSMLALQFFQDDLNGALKVAGSFGSPLLYGVLPILMAYTQQQQQQEASQLEHRWITLPKPQLLQSPSPLPVAPIMQNWPTASLKVLGVASTGFFGKELWQGAQDVLATVASS